MGGYSVDTAPSDTALSPENGSGAAHRGGTYENGRLEDMVAASDEALMSCNADFGDVIRPQSQLKKITYALTVGGPQPTSYLATVLGLGLTRTREILASMVDDGVIEPIGVGRGRKYRLTGRDGSRKVLIR